MTDNEKKVLEIIKNKRVNVNRFLYLMDVLKDQFKFYQYNIGNQHYNTGKYVDIDITEDEFNTLKEFFKHE